MLNHSNTSGNGGRQLPGARAGLFAALLCLCALPAAAELVVQDFESWPEAPQWGNHSEPGGWEMNDGAIAGGSGGFSPPIGLRAGWLRGGAARSPRAKNSASMAEVSCSTAEKSARVGPVLPVNSGTGKGSLLTGIGLDADGAVGGDIDVP